MVSSSLGSAKANHLASSIYAKYGNFINKIIANYLKDEDEAADVFQKFFLNVIAKPLPNDAEYNEAYFYRAIANCIKNHVRQTACYQTHITEYAQNRRLVETEVRLDSEVFNTDEIDKLFAMIGKQLSPKEYLAVTLRYKNNYTFCDIAKAMNVEIASAKRYISRARKRLRSSLTREEVSALYG